jgi:hypothetical protein
MIVQSQSCAARSSSSSWLIQFNRLTAFPLLFYSQSFFNFVIIVILRLTSLTTPFSIQLSMILLIPILYMNHEMNTNHANHLTVIPILLGGGTNIQRSVSVSSRPMRWPWGEGVSSLAKTMLVFD